MQKYSEKREEKYFKIKATNLQCSIFNKTPQHYLGQGTCYSKKVDRGLTLYWQQSQLPGQSNLLASKLLKAPVSGDVVALMENEHSLQNALDKVQSPRTSEDKDHTIPHVPWASLPVEILGNIVRLGCGKDPEIARTFSQVCCSFRASVASEKHMLKELDFKTLKLTTSTIDNDRIRLFERTKKRIIDLPWILGKAANASNMAASILAARFCQLQGLEKESKKHWMRAARMNHPEACWRLGVAYYHGEGALTVQQDSEEALFWLNKAAKTLIASIKDLENIGTANNNGETTPRKLHFASEHCLLMSDDVCRMALKEASHILGVIHLDGDATKQDTGIAIKWLQMAEMCGCNEAAKMVQSLFRSGQY